MISKKIVRFTVFPIVLLLCASIIYGLYSIEPKKVLYEKQVEAAKTVRTELVFPSVYSSEISAYGVVRAVWETSLKSEVDGKIVYIANSIFAGGVVRKGDVLAKVEQYKYITAVKDAELRMANANLMYHKEKRAAETARANWENSGIAGNPESPLVFHIPQIQTAERELEAAEAQLREAKNALSKTEIKAPFNGVVAERYISKGDVLVQGAGVVRILSYDDLEIKINLGADQLSRLEKWQNNSVQITDIISKQKYFGKLVRSDGYVDDKTRQQGYYIKPLLNTHQLVLPGSFVKVTIEGDEVRNVFSTPESSVTSSGHVWYVDKSNLLQNFKADILFYKNGRVYISNSKNFENLNVVITPLKSYMAGQIVSPVKEIK